MANLVCPFVPITIYKNKLTHRGNYTTSMFSQHNQGMAYLLYQEVKLKILCLVQDDFLYLPQTKEGLEN